MMLAAPIPIASASTTSIGGETVGMAGTLAALVVELLLSTTTGSLSAVLTIAVFAIDPDEVALTVSVIVAVAPPASGPRVQTTVVVPLHDPWLDVTVTSARLSGSTSVTVAPLEASGPALVTVIV